LLRGLAASGLLGALALGRFRGKNISDRASWLWRSQPPRFSSRLAVEVLVVALRAA
jgi:hypothetical protein